MIGIPKGYVGILTMVTRLRALPWGWMVIAAVYVLLALPLSPQPRLFWLGLGTAAAYLVLARRTTIHTAALAQNNDARLLSQWKTAYRQTAFNSALLVVPFLALMVAAQQFMVGTTSGCPNIFRAYCMTYSGSPETETMLIACAFLGVFLLLDHGLLVALALFARKHITGSNAAGTAAVGMRFVIASALVSITMTGMAVFDLTSWQSYYPYGYGSTVTDWRIAETVYPAFEPLVTNGVFLGANVMNHPSFCNNYDYSNTMPNGSYRCLSMYDTRPYLLRQSVVALLGMLLYSGLILGVLRMTAPFDVQMRLEHKSKRGVVEPEAEIAYL